MLVIDQTFKIIKERRLNNEIEAQKNKVKVQKDASENLDMP